VSMLRRKLLRDLAARRWQIAAVALTVFLGVALFGASYDAFQNLQASYARVFADLHFADLTISDGELGTLPNEVAGVSGVAATDTRLVAEMPIRIDGHALVGRAVGMPTSGQPAIDQVLVQEGNGLDPADPNGVLVEHHLADQFGLAPGDSLDLNLAGTWQQVTVRGIVASPEYLWPARSRQELLVPFDQFGVVFVPEPLLQSLPAQAVTHELLVTYQPGTDRAALDAKLTAHATAAGAASQTKADQPSNAALGEDINGFGELSLLFPILFLGAAAMATYVLLNRLVYQQRAQIGLLFAAGFRRRDVFGHLISYGLLTGIAGGVPGALAGLGLGGIITGIYTGVIGIPLRVVELRPTTLVIGIVFALMAGALSALAPALRASRISPAEAMRGPVPLGTGGPSLLEHILPPLRRLPARWKMVIRGIGRNRVRSVSTLVGVALAIVLVLVSWGMLDTTQLLVGRQFGQIDLEDAEVTLASQASTTQVAEIAAVPGVAAAEPVAHLQVLLTSDGHQYATVLDGFEPGTTMHGFTDQHGHQVPLPADGLLLGSALRDQLHLAVGDAVKVTVIQSGASAQDRVAGFVNEPLGTLAYGSQPHLRSLLGDATLNAALTSVQVRFVPGSDAATVRGRLADLPGVLAVTNSQAIAQILNQYMGLFYAFIGVMLVFGAVMAFALLFVTISANVTERSTELATIRAVGMPVPALGRLITGENVLLALIGIVPGLVIGYVVAAGFMASFSNDLFSFDLAIRPTTFVGTAVAIVVATLLSQWPALRAVRHLDIARVVRERAS
jgi:putative ABC transport system permease protein